MSDAAVVFHDFGFDRAQARGSWNPHLELARELASTGTDIAKPGMAVAQMYGIGDVVVHKVSAGSRFTQLPRSVRYDSLCAGNPTDSLM